MPPKNQKGEAKTQQQKQPNAQKKQQQQESAKSVAPKKVQEEQEELIFWKRPFTTLRLFLKVFLGFLSRVFGHIVNYIVIYGIIAAAIVIPHLIEGEHTPWVKKFDEFVEFCGYWIILGVASSIGLGTGLHTFVLYTGPHIAKYTMAANEYGVLPKLLPSRWAIRPTFTRGVGAVTFLSVVNGVQWEAILWGLGTALGELPPYFVAKAASVAGNTNEELEELEKSGSDSIVDKLKLFIYKSLKRYGFITVLLCASIPNPLFDLAGITCGHFGIPLKTFLGATIIGKAFIKANLQVLFVVFMFSNHHVENVLSFLEGNLPFLKNRLSEGLAKQKEILLNPDSKVKGEENLIAVVWNYIIFAMIFYFIYKTIEALAQAELNKENEERAEVSKGSEKKKK